MIAFSCRRARRLIPVVRAGLIFLLMSSAVARAADITVFAASSLKDAVDEIARLWSQDGSHSTALTYGGSATLARQIAAGAPADVFISANEAWMDMLEKDGLLRPETRVDIVANRIVLIAHGPENAQDSPRFVLGPKTDLVGLLGDRMLAMALVGSVPAGIYGKAALQHLGLWKTIAPMVVQAENVRVALALVATGETPFGIVYASDARAEKNVHVVAQIPKGLTPPIRYPAAIIGESRAPLAADFLRFLRGPAAQRVFKAQGFGNIGTSK